MMAGKSEAESSPGTMQPGSPAAAAACGCVWMGLLSPLSWQKAATSAAEKRLASVKAVPGASPPLPLLCGGGAAVLRQRAALASGGRAAAASAGRQLERWGDETMWCRTAQNIFRSALIRGRRAIREFQQDFCCQQSNVPGVSSAKKRKPALRCSRHSRQNPRRRGQAAPSKLANQLAGNTLFSRRHLFLPGGEQRHLFLALRLRLSGRVLQLCRASPAASYSGSKCTQVHDRRP